MFLESLDRAVRKGRRRQDRFSVLFVDLDRFKEVNDTLGHAAGDHLLQAVAERLTSAVRQSDLVARMGGDEFVILVDDHRGPEEVMIVAQKVLSLLERPVLIDWREVKISGSVGIASFPEDGEDLEVLMKNADAAMYQAKERGRNNFQFFSAELNRLTMQRAELEVRVRQALEHQEFFLQYQPEVSLATGRIEAVEALLRWKDPGPGVVLPAGFLPSAEENGTIVAIGDWVLDRALGDLASWRERGMDITVSINLSARQLFQPDIAARLERAMHTHDVPPRFVRLELPETALMAESDKTDRSVRSLQRLGVQIAIDNFGTGYSSLGLVRGFSVNAVKIDRSLVSSCQNKRECAAIVHAVGAMARDLGITVIA
jgi:diguanylate cyclase (GGDEF)-like protein